MLTLGEHLRRLWAERTEMLTPRIPPDLPDFAARLVEQQGDWRIKRGAEIDAEINEMLRFGRELGAFEARRK